MVQLLNDRRDIQFVLYEQLCIESLTKDSKYSDLNRKTFDLVISEAKALAIKELLPASIEGDVQGCSFENGKVTVPAVFHSVYKLIVEGEWIALSDDLDVGGQGMPQIIKMVVDELFQGANTCLALSMGLTHGAGKLIEIYGTEEQKKLYLKKVYSGEWTGTMALTEAGAGSEVGELEASAKKNPDGTYSITGNKVFITQAENNLTENIINPVLARIEGSPKGTRGISLFLVPKYLVNEDGSLGERNDIECTGIEEKIGIHGSPTCSMAMGSKGNCIGTLLGKENEGLKSMFHMMNEARLFVAMQGLGLSSTAYLYALNYARERFQGKHITKLRESDAKQVPLIEHPDIKRMLMMMKSSIEGLRSLNYYVGLCIDQVGLEATSQEEKKRLNGLIALLIPICKAHTTERGFELCNMAIQIYGGAGACREYPVEQLLRDIKIATIYEGTTGIQAMDLLGRKIGMNKGRVFQDFIEEINKTVITAENQSSISVLARQFKKALDKFKKTALNIGQAAASQQIQEAFSQAYPFCEVSGDISIAWMLLWRASVASFKLDKILGKADEEKRAEKIAKNKDAAFYNSQIQTAQYFINSVIPKTMGMMDAINNLDSAVVNITDAGFGGK